MGRGLLGLQSYGQPSLVGSRQLGRLGNEGQEPSLPSWDSVSGRRAQSKTWQLDQELRPPGFTLQPCVTLASDFTTLRLSRLICKMGVIMIHTSYAVELNELAFIKA